MRIEQKVLNGCGNRIRKVDIVSEELSIAGEAAGTEAFAAVFEGPGEDRKLSMIDLDRDMTRLGDFERMAGHYIMLARGVTIAYAESVEAVPANLAEVRPTVLCSVPRLYEKIHDRATTVRAEVLEWIVVLLIVLEIALPFVLRR